MDIKYFGILYKIKHGLIFNNNIISQNNTISKQERGYRTKLTKQLVVYMRKYDSFQKYSNYNILDF